MQLAAFIHFNPFRAWIVEDAAALKDFPFTGHSALMSKRAEPWQDTAYVPTLFGGTVLEDRRKLQRHVFKWSAKGHCLELTGGGLIRSARGWRAAKEARRDGIRFAGDERILGSSEFVEMTLKQADEVYERRMQMPIKICNIIDAYQLIGEYNNGRIRQN